MPRQNWKSTPFHSLPEPFTDYVNHHAVSVDIEDAGHTENKEPIKSALPSSQATRFAGGLQSTTKALYRQCLKVCRPHTITSCPTKWGCFI